MIAFVDYSTTRYCWNHDAFFTCLGCGCCSKDKDLRYLSRLRYCERMLEEERNFSNWSDDEKLRLIQKENVAANIRYLRRRKSYYKKKLKEVENDE